MFSILNYLGIYKFYENYLKRQINLYDSPGHIAIILDGNRRWARSRLMPVWMGHLEGANIVTDLLDWCNELNARFLVKQYNKTVKDDIKNNVGGKGSLDSFF